MWIRTQGNELINLSNVLKIDIVKLNHGNMNNRHVMASNQILGTYPTEQRALEVFDEIQERLMGKVTIYEDGHIEPFSVGDVYVMPVE